MTRSYRRIPLMSPLALVAVAALSIASGAAELVAQTDYYNTDAGRPVLIEDAYPTERYAFELQLAPLRLERLGDGIYNWGVEPEIAYGILPRTHVEIGFPLAWTDASGTEEEVAGLAGIDISALHNLNTETSTLPAFGIAAEATLPVGPLAPDRVYPSVKGIVTRTFTWARFHLNARYTFGPGVEAPSEGPDFGTADSRVVAARQPEDVGETTRWMAGIAVDRVFPLKATLLIADLYAEQPLVEEEEIEWNAGAGMRYQYGPRLALDAGIGRRLTGVPGWFVTFGSAYAFAVRSLIPVR